MKPTMNEQWQVTINELMDIFHSSILSLLPWMKKAHIKWKEEEAYDDWDRIVSSLFENIVIRSILSSEEIPHNSQIPEYDLALDSYKEFIFIILKFKDTKPKSGKWNIFIGYSSKDDPMDTIKYITVDKDFKSDNIIQKTSIKNVDYAICDSINQVVEFCKLIVNI